MLPVNKKRGEEGGISYHLQENMPWVFGRCSPMKK